MNNNVKRRSSRGRVTSSQRRVSQNDEIDELENDQTKEESAEEGFSVLDLNPETHYQLRMTAHNSAGSTVRIYEFTTLTFGGATVAPELIIHSEYNYGFINLLLNPSVILPTLSAVIVIAVIILVLGHQLKKDRLFGRGE